MARSGRKAEDVIRERKAAEALAKEVSAGRVSRQLNQRIEEFTSYFRATTQAALERLERNDYPGGDLYKLPDEAEELAVWKLPGMGHVSDYYVSYYLASDGSIRECRYDELNVLQPFLWKTISPASVRSSALEMYELFHDIDSSMSKIKRIEVIVYRCNLICPDWGMG